jgi:hypothetical protein
MELNQQEQMTLNQFIGENWSSFTKTARLYLSEDEAEGLADKLSGGDSISMGAGNED